MNKLREKEYWDLFDSERIIIAKNHIRGDIIPEGLYHLVVHVWIMNKQGKFLISQRQVGKPDSLLWERTGGSVLMGESSLEGAVREAKEELNVDLSKYKPIYVKTVKREKYHDFYDSWLFIVDDDISVKVDDNEVKDYRWVTLDELRKMAEERILVKSSMYFEEVYELFIKER